MLPTFDFFSFSYVLERVSDVILSEKIGLSV